MSRLRLFQVMSFLDRLEVTGRVDGLALTTCFRGHVPRTFVGRMFSVQPLSLASETECALNSGLGIP